MPTNVRSSRFLACVLLGVTLTGCATAQPSPGAYGAPAPSTEPPQHSLMAGILNALALPIYLPFKVVVCAATIALAAPATAITAVTDPDGTGWQRESLTEGFTANCGPPWLP